jgi:hypothetical protein
MIGVLTKHMQRNLETRRYSQEEICTLLQETPQIVNSRPLAGGSGEGVHL